MTRGTSGDPRYLRVRAALVAALLRLAAEVPAESIGVSDLTGAAGVSRQTFYGHAPSPAGLLTATLVDELAPAVETLGRALLDHDHSFEGAWRTAYADVLTHVAGHRPVYEVMVGSHSTVFSAVLGSFEAPSRIYVEAIAEALESGDPGPLWTEMAVQQQVANLGAVIRAWISTGMEGPAEAVVDTYMTLAPPWQLARRDATGHISMRRLRAVRPQGEPGRTSRAR